jgi:hypothetical protein
LYVLFHKKCGARTGRLPRQLEHYTLFLDKAGYVSRPNAKDRLHENAVVFTDIIQQKKANVNMFLQDFFLNISKKGGREVFFLLSRGAAAKKRCAFLRRQPGVLPQHAAQLFHAAPGGRAKLAQTPAKPG